VLFAEPPRTQADLHFVLFGIPVRVHPLFWLVAVLFNLNAPPLHVLLWIAALLVSILIHELGHAVVMRWFGDHPRIVLHGFGGLAIPEGVGRRPGPWGQILISLSGPGAGFLVAVTVVAALLFLGFGDSVDYKGPFRDDATLVPNLLHFIPRPEIEEHEQLSRFLRYFFQVSVYWGLINLLPIYPLDGGHIAQELLMLANPRDGARQSLLLSISTAGALAVLSLMRWNDFFLAVLFGYLAYSSYMTLQAYSGRW
jgi:stage IV sporulation protein FB